MSLATSYDNNASLFQSYDPAIYQSIPDFLDVKDSVAALEPALFSVGAVICRHNLQEVVGLGLLHSHFEQADDEILVWRQPTEDGWAGGIVKRREALSARPILWKVEHTPGRAPICFPIEFFERAEGWLETKHDPAAMHDIIAKIVELNLADVVGIRALHPDIQRLAKEKDLIETYDEKARTLFYRRMTPSELRTIDPVETGWSFMPDNESEFGCVFQCHTGCGGAV